MKLIYIEGGCFCNMSSDTSYGFSKVNINIDDIKVDNISRNFEFSDLILPCLGFNNIYVPYILIAIFLILQIIFLKKYKKIKEYICIDLIVILLIAISNLIIGKFRIGLGDEVIPIEITNIVVNSLILIIGIIIQKRVNKYSEEKIVRFKKIAFISIIIFITIFLITLKLDNKEMKMHVVESQWGFGYTIDKKIYDYELKEGDIIGNTKFKVIDIDNDGVLLEYTREYYETSNDSPNGVYKTEVVKQKLNWNVNYEYKKAENPFLEVDGGTDYYVRLEKND